MKNWRLLTIISMVLLLTVSLACAVKTQSSEREVPAAPAPPPMASYSMSKGVASTNDSAQPGGQGGSVERKIVRTGSFTLEVKDIGKAQDDIGALAGQMGGFIVSSNQRANDDNPTGYISIRVPAERFNEAAQKIKALGIKVVYETTNSQDVTEQYTDLKSQLKNLEATEAQYLELMKKADNVKDILEVQRELSNVRGDIERVKGRIQYLDRTSDMSLIEVSLKKSKPIGESKWEVSDVLKSAVDGLIAFGEILISLIIWLLVFSPVWILIIVIVWLVRRKKKAKALPKT